MTLTVETDRQLVRPTVRGARHALVSIVAACRANRYTTARECRFRIDRSGSMGGSKFELARRAVDHALRLLRSDDRFSLVVYDNEITVIAESVPATPDACQRAGPRWAVHPRGSTNLCGGWLAGCEQVAQYHGGRHGRCLPAHGRPGQSGCYRSRAISTTSASYGVAASSHRHSVWAPISTSDCFQQMADAGAGHFYFIEAGADSRSPDERTGRNARSRRVGSTR